MRTRHGQMEILKPWLTCTQYSRVKTKYGERDLKDERLFWLSFRSGRPCLSASIALVLWWSRTAWCHGHMTEEMICSVMVNRQNKTKCHAGREEKILFSFYFLLFQLLWQNILMKSKLGVKGAYLAYSSRLHSVLPGKSETRACDHQWSQPTTDRNTRATCLLPRFLYSYTVQNLA